MSESDADAVGRRLLAEELASQRLTANQLAGLSRLPLVGVLENIRSLGNVGSMFRTADATRMERLVLCGFTGHPPRKEIEKTALGAQDVVPWEYWSSAAEACQRLRVQGFEIVALELTTRSVSLDDFAPRGPTAFVVGNELAGVSDEALRACSRAVAIPMAGAKESLNVAVAFGVAAYALRARLLSRAG